MKLTRLLSLVAAALAPLAVFAATGGTAIPGGDVNSTYVITQTGYYYLTGNRTMTDVTQPAIEVKANDVTIDLNGFNLRNKPGKAGNKALIRITNTDNIEVRNGSLTDSAWAGISAVAPELGGRLIVRQVRFVGMFIGVNVAKLSGVSIENCTFDGMTGRGVDAYFLAGDLEVHNSSFVGLIGIWCNTSPFQVTNSVFNVGTSALRASSGSTGRFEGNKVKSALGASAIYGGAVEIDNYGSSADVVGNSFVMTAGGRAVNSHGYSEFTLVEGNTFVGGYAVSSISSKGLIINNRLKTGTQIGIPGGKLPASNLFF